GAREDQVTPNSVISGVLAREAKKIRLGTKLLLRSSGVEQRVRSAGGVRRIVATIVDIRAFHHGDPRRLAQQGDVFGIDLQCRLIYCHPAISIAGKKKGGGAGTPFQDDGAFRAPGAESQNVARLGGERGNPKIQVLSIQEV